MTQESIEQIAGRWLREQKIHSVEVNLAAILVEFHLFAINHTASTAKRDAFQEVENFIATYGRNADIQSFVEKKICALE